ncbi:glycosyltransferase family 4 protein [Salipaludibacillus sp. CUR1]|uniref:glycosyltransferase family 4 protein n=1 Tax=Salipaludibacillus sp. CUR1 TaxID=2820003 RepID=UPI001E5FE359|nr:glycosyltransferase family 4 protein [Salipaludibacillus sp. CUR1]MCE7791186.1 glycosyltransferase family 4 protein [Salipaludibacillus sp. CUR1]
MKVLFIASYSGTSGANHSLINLIKILKTKGVEPYVIIPTSGKLEKELMENKIPYKKIRLYNWIVSIDQISKKENIKWLIKSLINYWQELRIYLLIKKKKIKVMHINAVTAAWGLNAAQKNNVPIVWHIREFLEEDLNKKFRNRNSAIKKLNKANVIIAISKSVEKKYSKIINKAKLITIYNGIDHNKFSNIENDIFNKDTITVTIAGRIVKEKGHKEVIYAIQKVIDMGVTNIKLLIVGNEGDFNFISQIEELVFGQNLDNHVHFLGYRGDMENIWSQTDIAIISSKAEAFGRVTIEAMMGGALVLGANTGGTIELINDKYGLIYEQGNYKSLADNIIYAINNKAEMKVIAKQAKINANKNFTALMNAENIFNVYKSLK